VNCLFSTTSTDLTFRAQEEEEEEQFSDMDDEL
jgi:hypothetical protein